MLIGEQSVFAIEWEVVDKFDEFVYGHFRFWIAGEPLGNWDGEAVLGVLIHSAIVFLKFKGDRHVSGSDSLGADELWTHIDYFSHSDDAEALNVALAGNYRVRFLLHELADDSVGTVCKIFLVDRMDGAQRILWRRSDSNQICEVTCPKTVVDEVVASFIEKAGAGM